MKERNDQPRLSSPLEKKSSPLEKKNYLTSCIGVRNLEVTVGRVEAVIRPRYRYFFLLAQPRQPPQIQKNTISPEL